VTTTPTSSNDRRRQGVGAELDPLAEPEQPGDQPDQGVDHEDHRHDRGRQAPLLKSRLAEQDRRRTEDERDEEGRMQQWHDHTCRELAADRLELHRREPVTEARRHGDSEHALRAGPGQGREPRPRDRGQHDHQATARDGERRTCRRNGPVARGRIEGHEQPHQPEPGETCPGPCAGWKAVPAQQPLRDHGEHDAAGHRALHPR